MSEADQASISVDPSHMLRDVPVARPNTASDLNFREIRVTETGIDLDGLHIPAYAITPGIVVGARGQRSQSVTLTICADRIVFEGAAKAEVQLPETDGSNPHLYPPRRDETMLAGEHRPTMLSATQWANASVERERMGTRVYRP